MAVTLDEISGWLTELDYGHKQTEDAIFYATGTDELKVAVIIKAKEDGSLFELEMGILNDDVDKVCLKDNEYLDKILPHLLYLNYSTKFGTWEYDPSDGDVHMQIEIPLEDALMTKKQFERIVDYVAQNGHTHAEEIIQIMKTGEVPAEDNPLVSMMTELFMEKLLREAASNPEMQAKLNQLGMASESSQKADSEDGI